MGMTLLLSPRHLPVSLNSLANQNWTSKYNPQQQRCRPFPSPLQPLSLSIPNPFSLYNLHRIRPSSSPSGSTISGNFGQLNIIRNELGNFETKSECLIGFVAYFSGFRVIMAWWWRRTAVDLVRFVTLRLSLLRTSNGSALCHLRNALALFCFCFFYFSFGFFT